MGISTRRRVLPPAVSSVTSSSAHTSKVADQSFVCYVCHASTKVPTRAKDPTCTWTSCQTLACREKLHSLWLEKDVATKPTADAMCEDTPVAPSSSASTSNTAGTVFTCYVCSAITNNPTPSKDDVCPWVSCPAIACREKLHSLWLEHKPVSYTHLTLPTKA